MGRLGGVDRKGSEVGSRICKACVAIWVACSRVFDMNSFMETPSGGLEPIPAKHFAMRGVAILVAEEVVISLLT